MILHELLSSDNVLMDIPTVAAPAHDPKVVLFNDRETLARATDEKRQSSVPCKDLEQKYGSHIRYSLHPQILGVCQQLYEEGKALLYKNVVGITYLHGYGSSWGDSVYCLGTKSVTRALKRWPGLHQIKKWEILIYLGPALAGEPELQEMSEVDEQYESLRSIEVEHLTISYKSATIKSSHYTSPLTADNNILAFSLFPDANIIFNGDVLECTKRQMAGFDLHKLRQPIRDSYNALRHLLNSCIKTIPPCDECQSRYVNDKRRGRCVNKFAQELKGRYRSMRFSVDASHVADFYNEKREALKFCYSKVCRASSGCITCTTGEADYEPGMLNSLLDSIAEMDESGPWKQKIWSKE